MYRVLSLADQDFCSIACRQVARRVSAELLLTVNVYLTGWKSIEGIAFRY